MDYVWKYFDYFFDYLIRKIRMVRNYEALHTICLKIGLEFIRIIFINFSCCFSPINSIRPHKIGPVHLDQSLETSKVGYSALSLAKKFKIFFSNLGRASAIFFIKVYLLQ